MSRFALRSERVMTPNGLRAATVVIQDEKIEAIADYSITLDCPVDDVGRMVILPGLVDSHVHINEPGRTEWEGFATATQAAAAGGITTLVDMPLNCIPVTTSESALLEKLTAVKNQLWVDCGFWGGVVPQSIDQLDQLLRAGVLGVKSFLIDSGIEEFPPMTEQDLNEAMPIVARYGLPYLIHAELEMPSENETAAVLSYDDFVNSRPKKWENEAVRLMLKLSNMHKCKVHIVHLSSAEALPFIEQAKRDGSLLSVETCPHYLTLNSEGISKSQETLHSASDSTSHSKVLFKCCPPIRDNANRLELWDALKKGLIDFVVSDHSPCSPELKLIEQDDLEKAWGGIAALQFGLPLIWHEGKKQGVSLRQISELMSRAPAEFVGLSAQKGMINVGLDADLVVFDDEIKSVILREEIHHKHKISPYVGKPITGKVLQTYLRGQLVYKTDTFFEGPHGKPILRQSL